MSRGYTSFLNAEFAQVLVVYGMPGVGKTTARDILQWLHCDVFYKVIDTDDLFLTDVRALMRYIKDVVREGTTAHPVVVTNNWLLVEALVKLGSTLIASVRWQLNTSACIRKLSDMLIARAQQQDKQQMSTARALVEGWTHPTCGTKVSRLKSVIADQAAKSLAKPTCFHGPSQDYSPTEVMSLWSSRKFNQAVEAWEPVLNMAVIDPTRRLGDAYTACLVALAVAMRWALELEFRATGAADGLLGSAMHESDELLERLAILEHLSSNGTPPATFDVFFDTAMKGGAYVYNG